MCEVYPCFYYLRHLQKELIKLENSYHHRKGQLSRPVFRSAKQTKNYDLQKVTTKIKSVNFMICKVDALLDQSEEIGFGQCELSPLNYGEEASCETNSLKSLKSST